MHYREYIKPLIIMPIYFLHPLLELEVSAPQSKPSGPDEAYTWKSLETFALRFPRFPLFGTFASASEPYYLLAQNLMDSPQRSSLDDDQGDLGGIKRWKLVAPHWFF